MYLTEAEKGNLRKFFNSKEIENLYLWDTIGFQRGIEFIKTWQRIVECSIDYNSFGRFIFVSGFYYGTAYTLWGLGIHEYRQIKIMNWRMNSGNECLYKDKPDLEVNEVLTKKEGSIEMA